MSAERTTTQSFNGPSKNGREGGTTDVRLASKAVMFTDMAESTEFAEKHGSLAAVQKRREHNELLCPLVGRQGGTLIKVIGDALLAVFDDAVAATQCAVEMQKRLVGQREGRTSDRQIHVRVGIHVGESALWHEDGRMEIGGRAVNVASRVEVGYGKKTDEVVLSREAVAELEDHGQFVTCSVGKVSAHGVGELKLHRVLWQESELDSAATQPDVVGRRTYPMRRGCDVGMLWTHETNMMVSRCVVVVTTRSLLPNQMLPTSQPKALRARWIHGSTTCRAGSRRDGRCSGRNQQPPPLRKQNRNHGNPLEKETKRCPVHSIS